MGDRVRNAYSGGYSDAIKRQLERVVIPERVKCITCKKMRMHSTYSKRQLDVLRNAMVVQGDRALMGPGHAKCRECVGGQTVELRCIICDKTKSLEEFAKAQRHDRDLARCLTCVQNHTETDPVIEEQKLLTESEMSTVQETTATSVDDGYSYSTSVYGEGDSDDVDDDDDYSVGGGVWVEAEHPQESSRSKSNEREYTGYDQHGMPHRLVSSRPVVPEGVHTGWASWGITANSAKAHGPRASPFESSRSNKPSSVQKKPSNFAKIPKMRPERSSPPAMRTPEPSGHNIPYEGDGGNDSVEDYL